MKGSLIGELESKDKESKNTTETKLKEAETNVTEVKFSMRLLHTIINTFLLTLNLEKNFI